MTRPAKRSRVAALPHTAPTPRRLLALIFSCSVIFFAAVARAQLSTDDPTVTRSVSGQFIVSATPGYSPLSYRRNFTDNTNFIRLEPALLAVAAERFKVLLWQQLGLPPGSPWRGKIFLVLHPAQSPDDGVVIASGPIIQTWDYRVALPDLLTRTRYARALSAVLLLEIANRHNAADGHSAEIPAWLADGLAQQALDEDAAKLILSTPAKTVNDLLQSSLDDKQRGLDPLASARKTLRNSTALTFDELSWPADEQANGDDGGVYLASAQLFVHELLESKNGPVKMRALLAQLPGCLNWQTAFFSAFHNDFRRPVDVEKWWSLRVVDFAAHNSGAQWTVTDSHDELTDLLSVPVEIRDHANSLPTHAEISLQTAIRNFAPAQRDAMLQAKLRGLELAQFHVAPPFAALTAGYRTALADFLGGRKRFATGPSAPVPAINRHPTGAPTSRTGLSQLKKQAGNYQAGIANYFDELKKNPQLGIVNQSQPAVPPNSASRPAAVNRATPVDFYAEPEDDPPVLAGDKHPAGALPKRASVSATLEKLDELDARRRDLEIRLQLDLAPRNMASSGP